MATVLHTPAPCEPLTTLIAACFGDQPTPALALPARAGTTDEHWHDAVTQVGEQLRAKLHVEVLPDRLHKALALVLAHAVTLHPDGTASVEVTDTRVTLREGVNSLFHPEGTALVIHAAPDDDVTDPAGNAGARIACGVIAR